MKKLSVLTAAVAVMLIAFVWGCTKKGKGLEDFSDALNMQYESYKIIKENSGDPARAGSLFTEYHKKNRDALAAAFRRYYRKYGDGSQLSKDETDFLDGEMEKVNSLLADKDIRKVMDDPAFIEQAREGSEILSEIREGAQ